MSRTQDPRASVLSLPPEIRGSVPESDAEALPLPVIARDGIRWSGGRGNRPLVLALSFENPGDLPTEATTARVQVAEYGVFQDWRGLTEVEIPAIFPGDREIVTGLAPAHGLPEVPPAKDEEARILDVHYVGNINVFVTRDAAVERHVRRTIGLRADRENVSHFYVGDGQPDSYAFALDHCEAGWDVSLFRGDHMPDGSPNDSPGVVPREIAFGEPVLIAREFLTAIIRPPARAETGRIEIGVKRGSTGESATVEFELETTRLGSRCYYL